jgi:hypothetical protein
MLGYGALQDLLNTVSEELHPRVRVVSNPRDRGAGTTDGGLYISDQFRGEDRVDQGHGLGMHESLELVD